jgi:hypothetical protein
MQMRKWISSLWLSRILVGIVLSFNLECAFVFILQPHRFASGFDVSGASGEAIVKGFGVLFLMWNIPYIFAVWHPVRFRVSLTQAVIMQAVGLIGESFILSGLPEAHLAARTTILRFIGFDGFGLLLLILAFRLSRKHGADR